MLYVGGLRPRHIVGAYEDLGMVVIATGYEFGHRDDYERTFPLMPKKTLSFMMIHPTMSWKSLLKISNLTLWDQV